MKMESLVKQQHKEPGMKHPGIHPLHFLCSFFGHLQDVLHGGCCPGHVAHLHDIKHFLEGGTRVPAFLQVKLRSDFKPILHHCKIALEGRSRQAPACDRRWFRERGFSATTSPDTPTDDAERKRVFFRRKWLLNTSGADTGIIVNLLLMRRAKALPVQREKWFRETLIYFYISVSFCCVLPTCRLQRGLFVLLLRCSSLLPAAHCLSLEHSYPMMIWLPVWRAGPFPHSAFAQHITMFLPSTTQITSENMLTLGTFERQSLS